MFPGSPARIYLWTSVRLELEGTTVQLFCRAEGYPAPKCSWRYSEYGDEIVDDDQHQVSYHSHHQLVQDK